MLSCCFNFTYTKTPLKANWMAQELLTSFPSEVNEISLKPIVEPAGTFRVTCNGDVIWDRRDEATPGFPEAKELKQLVRDRVAPNLDLGHSDDKSKVLVVRGENEIERDRIKGVIQTYLDGLYEGDVNKLSMAFHSTCLLTSVNEAQELSTLTRGTLAYV